MDNSGFSEETISKTAESEIAATETITPNETNDDKSNQTESPNRTEIIAIIHPSDKGETINATVTENHEQTKLTEGVAVVSTNLPNGEVAPQTTTTVPLDSHTLTITEEDEEANKVDNSKRKYWYFFFLLIFFFGFMAALAIGLSYGKE